VQAKRFLRSWIIAFLALATTAIAFNCIMDPYLVINMPRIVGFNARKPAADTQQQLMKAYDAVRAQPRTLILGSSRVAIGLDAHSPAWPEADRPVYNLGLAGSSPYVAYRYFQHVIARHDIALVVLGLEFQSWVDFLDPPNTDFESRLLVRSDGSANANQRRERVRDSLMAAFSLDALIDSFSTFAANTSGDSSDLVAGNWDWNLFRKLARKAGSHPLIARADLEYFHWYFKKQKDWHVMADVQAILDLSKSQGTRVILVLNPSHVDELELLDLVGDWNTFEEWKRELTAVAEQYNTSEGHSRVEVWDFCGYDSYSTELVPTDKRPLHWFWDTVHYTRPLGDIILKRIFGATDSDFGALLTPDNIDSRLAAIRQQRLQYRAHHREAVQRVRNIYNLASGIR
jgi:hypothetical protein